MAVIDVHSFGFTYPGAQRPAVREVSFHVEPGEIFGFLGPSGAGKSTTQNVLIRLLDGYEGEISECSDEDLPVRGSQLLPPDRCRVRVS